MEKRRRLLPSTFKPKKKTKVGIARYINDMAEEEDEELDEKKIESARLEKEDQDVRLEIERQDRRRNQESLFEGADADVADVVSSLHERYRRTTQLASDLDDIHEGLPCAHDSSRRASRQEATRQANTPSLTDPRLWLVPCKTGCELESVISLMNKCIAMANQKAGIRSAMSTGLHGFIYVESRSEAAAYETVKGLRLLRGWSMTMVPMGDMMAVVATDLDAAVQSGVRRRVPKVGDWARISRDKYRNDLCRIVSLGDGGTSAVIKLVPRIGLTERAAGRYGYKVRPPRRPFNVNEVVAAGGNVSQQKFCSERNSGAASQNWELADNLFYIHENASYLEGFLYKEVKIKSMLQVVDANPTLDELQSFAIDTREEAESKASLAAQIDQLAKGSGAESESGNVQKFVLFAPNEKVSSAQKF